MNLDENERSQMAVRIAPEGFKLTARSLILWIKLAQRSIHFV